jgi:hypothetical protein
MTARDLEKAVQQCPVLVPYAEVAALVWTVPTFAPMSLLWFGRLLEERVRYRLQIGVAKATREYTIQNPGSNPSEGTDVCSLACGSPSRLDASFAEAAVQR